MCGRKLAALAAAGGNECWRFGLGRAGAEMGRNGTVVDGNAITAAVTANSLSAFARAVSVDNGTNITISNNTIDADAFWGGHSIVSTPTAASFTAASIGNERLRGGCANSALTGHVYFTNDPSC